MPYKMFMQDIDASDHLRNATLADTAHRMEAGPFTQGLAVTLSELPPEPGNNTMRFGLKLKDVPFNANPTPPAVSGLWQYELLFQHLDKAGVTKQVLSIKGAHEMSIAAVNAKFEVVLAELPKAGGVDTRFYLKLQEL